MFSKNKPKGNLNLLIVQPLKELARLGDILEKLNKNNMETKEMKIVPPEGYEIDKENSTFECVKFKPIKMATNYKEVEDKLFTDVNKEYFINAQSSDKDSIFNRTSVQFIQCCSDKQLEKIIAIAKMMNVAKYLNGEDCKPDWNDKSQLKFFIRNGQVNNIGVSCVTMTNDINVFFKSEEAAQQAIDILGEETIRLALSTDW